MDVYLNCDIFTDQYGPCSFLGVERPYEIVGQSDNSGGQSSNKK